MRIEINVADYLSEEQYKGIIIDELQSIIREKFKSEKEIERIIMNTCYHEVYSIIDEKVPGHDKIIADKVSELLNDIKSYQIFIKKSYYDDESLGQRILDSAVKENEELIKKKVREVIENKDYTVEVVDKLESLFEDATAGWYDLFDFLRKKK